MHINFSKTRQLFVFSLAVSLFTILCTRLFFIQILQHEFLSDLAAKQHKIFIKLEPQRGNIYDKLNRVLAINLDTGSLYVVPREIDNKENAAKILASNLSIDKKDFLRRLNKDNYFAWLKRKIDHDLAQKIDGLNIKGIYITNEPKRFYPSGKLACHIVGLTGIDNEGLEGIELYYNKELKGEYGWRQSFRDAKKREIASFERDALPARDGDNIVLTVDEVIQHIIEKEIEHIVKLYKPKAVSIIALNPSTGEILGLANYQPFDPNDLPNINMEFLKNSAIANSFEPGSVFKVVTASAALEEKVVDFNSEFFCENGAYKVRKRILHDHRPHATLNFRQIIEKSSNIGTVKVASKLGKEKLYAYIKKFNFGGLTGVDLPGEASGIVRPLSEWSYVDMTTVPMGQGIAITALQLASCISVIANDGIMMRPYIAKKFLNQEGVVIKENGPKVTRRVISEKTADKVKELLEGVIERGTGTRARLDNFRACGKTGTAQKVSPRGGYYEDKYIASFIGFAPYDKPVVSLAICVDEPHGQYFGGQVGAPAFKNIMEKILSYLEVESDRNET